MASSTLSVSSRAGPPFVTVPYGGASDADVVTGPSAPSLPARPAAAVRPRREVLRTGCGRCSRLGMAGGTDGLRLVIARCYGRGPNRPSAVSGTGVGCRSRCATTISGDPGARVSGSLSRPGTATGTQTGATRVLGGGGAAPTRDRSGRPSFIRVAGVSDPAPISGRSGGGATTWWCGTLSAARTLTGRATGITIPVIGATRDGVTIRTPLTRAETSCRAPMPRGTGTSAGTPAARRG